MTMLMITLLSLLAGMITLLALHGGSATASPTAAPAAAAPSPPPQQRAFAASWASRTPAEKLALADKFYASTSVLGALKGDRLWIKEAFPFWPPALSPPPAACAGPLDILFAVHSSPAGAARRAVTRRTWGDPRALAPATASLLLFFVGYSAEPGVEAAIAAERAMYGDDIVQGGFKDSYRNMTLKHAFALRWVTESCAGARWIVRVDDDVAVNPFAVAAALRAADAAPPDAGSGGYWGPGRKGAYWVSKGGSGKHVLRGYVDRTYPPFPHGYALVIRRDVAARLVAAMDSTPHLWIDDVWGGGIVRAKARVGLTDIAARCCLDEHGDGCARSDERAAALWFSHMGGAHYAAAMPQLWARLLAGGGGGGGGGGGAP